MAANTATGATEIRAMYGGLQAAIGAMCVIAFLRPHLAGSVLFALAFLTGGLVFARIFGLIMDDSGSGYTYGAIIFEATNTMVATQLGRRIQ